MIATRYTLAGRSKTKQNTFSIFRRLKSKKTHKEKTFNPCVKALNHFDDFYGAVFLKKWPSIRLGLLSRQKQLAVINNFGDVTETEKFLQNEGAFDIRSFLNAIKQNMQNIDKTSKITEKTNLDEIILKQRQLVEEKTLNEIFPKVQDLHSRDTFFESVNSKKEHLGTYDPEDPKTSLGSDLSAAQIDTSRIILPDSKMQDSLLHDFVPATQLRGLENFVPECDYYKYYQSQLEMPINVENELDLDFPENLKVYTFDRGDMSIFSEPMQCAHGIYNYLKVDGAELLTALALGAQKSDKVLDLCSPTGNIAFCILQMLPQFLVCFDNNKKNIENIFSQYLFNYSSSWKDLLLVTSESSFSAEKNNSFDKVLVNVPCTEDKLSVFEKEGNIFHSLLIKKRLGLPKFQSLLLAKGLKLVKPGGTVVYSTATLSPVQNDGVVNEALKLVWQETKMECTIKNLSPALAHTSDFFCFANYLPVKFGTLVVPFLPTNFGPRYFCKIVKNEN